MTTPQPTRPVTAGSRSPQTRGTHPYLPVPGPRRTYSGLLTRCTSGKVMRTRITQISLICVVVCGSQLISSPAPNGGYVSASP